MIDSCATGLEAAQRQGDRGSLEVTIPVPEKQSRAGELKRTFMVSREINKDVVTNEREKMV